MNQGQPAAALHLDGVMLPSGERTGVWIVDGTVTFTPVPGATTIALGRVDSARTGGRPLSRRPGVGRGGERRGGPSSRRAPTAMPGPC